MAVKQTKFQIEKKRKIKELRIFRARVELKIKVLDLIDSFKSKKEPKHKYTKQDKQIVLAQILSKTLE